MPAGLDRDRVWRAIRAQTSAWDLAEIRMVSGQDEGVAEYVGWLVSAGLVRQAGVSGGEALYRATTAGRSTLATPREDGIERIRLDFVLTSDGAVHLVHESAPGAWDRVRAAAAAVEPAKVVVTERQPQRQSIRERLWAAMHEVGAWTRSSLAEHTGCKPRTIEDYTYSLVKAGLVERGPDGGWRLVAGAPVQRPIVADRKTIRRKSKTN